MFFTCFHRTCWVQQTGHALKRSMFYIVPFTNKCFKSIWTCCCDSAHMPSQNNPQLDCKWWHLCEPALILHYPALISPPQHDQFTFRTFRNNKRPWSCTTSQQGDIKGRNSKTARTAQAAKTRKLGQARKTRKTRKPRKPQKARKPWKRENHEKRENRENRKTAKPRRLAHNCLLHFQALSASFCFSIFSCSRFSWFSPVFSCLYMHLIVLATTRKLLA